MERRRTVFDLDFRDGKCEDGEYTIVIWMDLVRNVTVNEDIARTRGSYDTFWDARVGASDPEDLSVCAQKGTVSVKNNAKGKGTVSPRHVGVEEEKS